MSKHIGIVACSAEGAALCYRTICTEGPALMGRHMHPEITMHTHPLADYMNYIYQDDWSGVADLMLSSTALLAEAGAEFCICPDNTLHQAFDLVAQRSLLPWLHIADPVIEEARSRGFKHLGVTGTRYLMEGPVYRRKLGAAGIGHTIPENRDRIEINKIIFDELVNGVFKEDSRALFVEAIGRLKESGCDAVVLGCTEIPLIVNDEISPLPTLDSARLLARAALRKATGAGV